MNNKSFADCKYCGEIYCYNCSDHEEWEEFCSKECSEEYKKDSTTKKENKND